MQLRCFIINGHKLFHTSGRNIEVVPNLYMNLIHSRINSRLSYALYLISGWLWWHRFWAVSVNKRSKCARDLAIIESFSEDDVFLQGGFGGEGFGPR